MLGSVNQSIGAALARVHKKIRLWHLYTALLALGLVGIVLAVVLVYVRNGQKGKAPTQVQVDTPSNQSAARVNLGYAQYQGTVLENGVAQYLGLRYAKSPTGNLRWRAPVEPGQVAGDQAADNLGQFCLGTGVGLPIAFQDEDCLFANIWAPANATVDSKLPVWLMIQGGGYIVNGPIWNGSYVVEVSKRNVIFVNFNYRVGLYGFLASEQVRADGDLNVGLLDQRFMMRWVQKHIVQFGGDPDRVVLQGVSAGAGSVAHHLTAFGGKDEKLFHAAISESVFFPTHPRVAELEWQFDYLLSETGCSNASDAMSCLRETSLAVLQAANVATPFPGRFGTPPLFYWSPCIDGDLSRDRLYAMFENGDFLDVPVIFGTDNDEGSYFGLDASTHQEVAAFIQNNYPHLDNETTREILMAYPPEDPVPKHGAWFPLAYRAYGEVTFICPNIHILDSFQARPNANLQTWAYRYNVLSAENVGEGLGVPHTWETFAVFGPDSIGGIWSGPASYYGADAGMVPIMMNYWISFVRTLDPNVLRYVKAPEWSTWRSGSGQQQLKLETGNVSMENLADDLKSRCGMWKDLAGMTEQ
ncbi:carboxylesterase [Truncatella angustata]|uniref:Carboxylic ester hydrolase n=1 Tax=Truncatella angustata TaxID=152316 RepID=A0A9P8UXP4_9PEZI|nr:carboxylesterase [Truncatella angustata]KAH6660075.1 carboxylesterase [Truncatella angustata]